MIEGTIFGLVTYLSLVTTFLKLPEYLRKWLLEHKLITDLTASFIVYMVLGAISKSITAIVGAIIAGLLVGLSLELFSPKKNKG